MKNKQEHGKLIHKNKLPNAYLHSLFPAQDIACQCHTNREQSPAECAHVENPCCGPVNDYNAKQPVDSVQEGGGSQLKCPHTHFVKPAKRHRDTLQCSQKGLMSM